MKTEFVGLMGIVLVVLIAESVGLCLRRPLAILLRAEKGMERSDFWNAYIRIVLLLVPAAFALMSYPNSLHEDPLLALVDQLRWGLAGMLLTLAVAGHVVRSHPRTRPYVPPTSAVSPVANGVAR